ncbi:MAG TPA: Rv2578c family radical SAM protein [Micromonosporaceae bacterium]|nr:Rv2578c family radical SAM protein [Micromonosporaceae bacterium]
MRWDNLTATGGPDGDDPGQARAATPLPLALPGAVVRTFDTPEFAGITFYEVHAKSLLNRVPGASRVPFEWTVNPYRGCSHACVYCFARSTHTYLDLDAGQDFDSRVVVKVNAGELLRHELASPRWGGHHIAMGTNVDCYQRAEGRYRLMPEIIAALRDRANPFSILTKGTLIARDLDLLRQAAQVTTVAVAFSIGFLDPALWRTVEPGTPAPLRRLDVVRQFADAGFAVGVLMAPILPGLTDTDDAIEATVQAIATAGAATVSPLALHLRPGAREWYLGWLAREHPGLVPRYRELYRRGAYLDQGYQRELTARVRLAARRYGLPTGAADSRRRAVGTRGSVAPTKPTSTEQLTLL